MIKITAQRSKCDFCGTEADMYFDKENEFWTMQKGWVRHGFHGCPMCMKLLNAKGINRHAINGLLPKERYQQDELFTLVRKLIGVEYDSD